MVYLYFINFLCLLDLHKNFHKKKSIRHEIKKLFKKIFEVELGILRTKLLDFNKPT